MLENGTQSFETQLARKSLDLKKKYIMKFRSNIFDPTLFSDFIKKKRNTV